MITSIKDLIHQFDSDDRARCVQIRPDAINLANESICPELQAQVLSFPPAKTRYEKHHPLCLPLDGIQTINADYSCSFCPFRKDCTPQIPMDMIHFSAVIRFLLSHTSLRNFVLFLSTLQHRKIQLKDAIITINVLNRQRLGRTEIPP
jgi:hypothetical protein